MYQVIPVNNFFKQLKKLKNHKLEKSIHGVCIPQLQVNPMEGPSIGRYHQGNKEWKWRDGDYRVRYTVRGNIVTLHLVGHRNKIYRQSID